MRHLFKSTWFMPILLAILSAAGLTAALVGDGLCDVLSSLALAVPLLTAFWHIWRSGRASRG
jgi:hypothetical protein